MGLNPDTPVYVAGHRGMAGSAVIREFRRRGFANLVLRSRSELDLLDQAATEDFFQRERPKVVVFAAARVGGIHANNTYPAEFIYENIQASINCVHSAWRAGARRLLFLGSSCIYPRLAPQPMPEDCLLAGPLEPTNEAYAIAKIAGLKLCQHYRRQYGSLFYSVMPTNLYGPGDNYDLENSHVLPALVRKFHEARDSGRDEVVLWGTGAPRREFLHVDDLAAAVVFMLEANDPPDWINVGYGEDVAIRELADMIARVVGFEGAVRWDSAKPDGTPRKLLDSSRIFEMGWRPKIGLEEGIRSTYEAFKEELRSGNLRGGAGIG